MLATGTVERRYGGNPPEVYPLDVTVLLTLVPQAEATVGLRFDGVDGTPSAPMTAGDVQTVRRETKGKALQGNLHPVALFAGKVCSF
jgi:hypothetical protein